MASFVTLSLFNDNGLRYLRRVITASVVVKPTFLNYRSRFFHLKFPIENRAKPNKNVNKHLSYVIDYAVRTL